MAAARGRGRGIDAMWKRRDRDRFLSDSDSSGWASASSGITNDIDHCSHYSSSLVSSEECSPPPPCKSKSAPPIVTYSLSEETGEEKPTPPVEYSVMRNMIVGAANNIYGLNLDQDVRQYKDLVARRILPYRVRRVVSPYEFYMELTNVPPSRVYANWFHEMQLFYQKLNNQEKSKVFKGLPLRGRCYVCMDPNDHRWHRVRVHQIKDHGSHQTFVVYYLDLCKLQETILSHLRELDPTFANNPAQVLRCYLHDIRPNNKRNLQTWSPEACNFFQEAVDGKEFTGIVLTRSDELVSKEMPDIVSTLGIVLVENIPETKIPKQGVCTLNALMVDAKHALATGVCAGCKHTLYLEGCVPFFNQSEFDRLYPPVEEHPFTVPLFTDKTAAETRENEQTKLISSSKLDNMGLSAFGKSKNQAIEESMAEAEREGIAAFYKNTTVNLPEEIARRLARIDIVFVSSPTSIIAHLKSNQEHLKAMQKAMGQLVANEGYFLEGKPGTFVACCILERENGKEDNCVWCRGIIKSVYKTETKFYKILLTDFGNEVTVESVFVRRLPSYFEKIPSFAIRLHLEPKDFLPDGPAGWSMAARVEFRRYTSTWVNREPKYFCFLPTKASPIELSHFTHQIMYNSTNARWHSAQDPNVHRKSVSHKAIDAYRNHVMLRSLYASFGVDVQYEILIPDSHFWHFETVVDGLFKEGYAVKSKTYKTINRQHIEILDMATSLRVDTSPIIVSKEQRTNATRRNVAEY